MPRGITEIPLVAEIDLWHRIAMDDWRCQKKSECLVARCGGNNEATLDSDMHPRLFEHLSNAACCECFPSFPTTAGKQPVGAICLWIAMQDEKDLLLGNTENTTASFSGSRVSLRYHEKKYSMRDLQVHLKADLEHHDST